MKIDVNGESRQTQCGNLAELCRDLGHDGKAVATALNGEFVPAAKRAMTALREKDRVEILSPRQGG